MKDKKTVWARKKKKNNNNLCNCTHEGNVLHMLVIPTHKYYTIPKKYERIQSPSNELNATMLLTAMYSLWKAALENFNASAQRIWKKANFFRRPYPLQRISHSLSCLSWSSWAIFFVATHSYRVLFFNSSKNYAQFVFQSTHVCQFDSHRNRSSYKSIATRWTIMPKQTANCLTKRTPASAFYVWLFSSSSFSFFFLFENTVRHCLFDMFLLWNCVFPSYLRIV